MALAALQLHLPLLPLQLASGRDIDERDDDERAVFPWAHMIGLVVVFQWARTCASRTMTMIGCTTA